MILHDCCTFPTIWQKSQDITKLISLNSCLGDLHFPDPLSKSERGLGHPPDQRTIIVNHNMSCYYPPLFVGYKVVDIIVRLSEKIRRICNDILLGLNYIKARIWICHSCMVILIYTCECLCYVSVNWLTKK